MCLSIPPPASIPETPRAICAAKLQKYLLVPKTSQFISDFFTWYVAAYALTQKNQNSLRLFPMPREVWLSFPNQETWPTLKLLIILAGTPPIRQLPGNDFVTTAPAATVTLSPRETPARIIAPAPIQQLFPIVTGRA